MRRSAKPQGDRRRVAGADVVALVLVLVKCVVSSAVLASESSASRRRLKDTGRLNDLGFLSAFGNNGP